MLVTGAAGAIGSAVARAIAKRSRTATLSLVDVSQNGCASLAREIGGEARAFGWDLAKPDDLPAHVRALVRERGDIDALVNCAGIMEVQSIATMPWEIGARVIKIDFESPMRLMSLCVPSALGQSSEWIGVRSSAKE